MSRVTADVFLPRCPSLPVKLTYLPGPLPLSSCCFVPGKEKPSSDSSRNWHVGKPNSRWLINDWYPSHRGGADAYIKVDFGQV